MDDDMSDGSAIKVWKGFTFGGLINAALTIGGILVFVIGFTVTATLTYASVMQRFRDDERTTYWNHHQVMSALCDINKRQDKNYICSPLAPYRDERADGTSVVPPG